MRRQYLYVAQWLCELTGDGGARQIEAFLSSQAQPLSDQIFGAAKQIQAAVAETEGWSTQQHLAAALQVG